MGSLSGKPGASLSSQVGGGSLASGLSDFGKSISGGYKKSPLGSMTGSAGGIGGTGIEGPQSADIGQGTTVGDVTNAQNNAANSLASQQALLAALKGQNGINQQNAVASQQQNLANQLAENNGAGNQGAAMNQQQALNAQLSGANGVGTQNAAISGLGGIAGRQQGLEGQYQNIANGTGPNPAMAQLNQTTGQNVANQAALMAGQRGASSNVGLLARQAAQQGAATQQQAVGQGATMEANQRLNALQGLSNAQQAQVGTQQAIGGLGTTQAGMQQAGIGAQGNLAAQELAAQQAQQQAIANQANVVTGQQIGATTANSQAQLANQQAMQNALQGINSNNVAMQGNINSANAGFANTKMQGQQGFIGGLMNGIGGAAGLPGLGGGPTKAAGGGEVVKMQEGGDVPQPQPVGEAAAAPQSGPQSSFGKFLQGWASGVSPTGNAGVSPITGSNAGAAALDTGTSNMVKGIASRVGGAAEPPASPAPAGPGSSPMGNSGELMKALGGLASTGGHVAAKAPSEKAVKKGNSYDNDKIDAKLSEGEIVLPRSVTMSDDPIKSSTEFVRKVLAKRGKR